MDDLLAEFLTESNEGLDVIDAGLVDLERNPDNADLLNNIFRLLHTLKGTCGFLQLPRLEALSHAAETLMEELRDDAPPTAELVALILKSVDRIKLLLAQIEAGEGTEPEGDDSALIAELAMAGPGGPPLQRTERSDAAEIGETATARPHGDVTALPSYQSVRVNAQSLEDLRATAAELVASRAQLLEIARRSDDYELKQAVQRLADLVSGLQKTVAGTALQPIGAAWRTLPRLVRDLESKLDKDIELVLQGGDTELDRQIVELIRDPLLHMVRNCADHGLETREQRIAAGKSPRGSIALSARRDDGSLILEVLDDGRGLDMAKIRRKAHDRGLTSHAEFDRMTATQQANLIFRPGFSTADRVSFVSGRGVGLDAVRDAIEAAGGSIDVVSAPGEGTMFVIRLPLRPAPSMPGTMTSGCGPDKTADDHVDRFAGDPRPESHDRKSRDLNVLFVEDSRFFRDILVPVVEAAGYHVCVARNGREAMAYLRGGAHFRGIVIDLNMPETDGFQLAEILRGRPQRARIPTIALSSLATPEAIAEAGATGFDHCLAKSDRNGLLSCLDQIVRGPGIAA